MRTKIKLYTTAILALSLFACGGGDDVVATTPVAGSTAGTCDNTGTGRTNYRAATSAELASGAATYNVSVNPNSAAASTTTIVVSADGAVSFKGAAQTVLSVCYIPADSALAFDWNKSTGAGIYLSYINIYSVRKIISGVIAGDVVNGSF